jgi:hypothetical protein
MARRSAPAVLAAVVPGLEDCDLDAFWEEYRRAAPPLLRFGFRASLVALELLPPLMIRRLALFRQLDEQTRADYLAKVDASPSFALRQMMQTIKLIGCFAYLRDEDVRRRVDGEESR